MSDIRTPPATEEYREGWERIFGKKDEKGIKKLAEEVYDIIRKCVDCKYFSNMGGPYCEKDGTAEIPPPFGGLDCFEKRSEKDEKSHINFQWWFACWDSKIY